MFRVIRRPKRRLLVAPLRPFPLFFDKQGMSGEPEISGSPHIHKGLKLRGVYGENPNPTIIRFGSPFGTIFAVDWPAFDVGDRFLVYPIEVNG